MISVQRNQESHDYSLTFDDLSREQVIKFLAYLLKEDQTELLDRLGTKHKGQYWGNTVQLFVPYQDQKDWFKDLDTIPLAERKIESILID